MPASKSAAAFAVPRHKITITQSVAQRLHAAGALAASHMDASEQH